MCLPDLCPWPAAALASTLQEVEERKEKESEYVIDKYGKKEKVHSMTIGGRMKGLKWLFSHLCLKEQFIRCLVSFQSVSIWGAGNETQQSTIEHIRPLTLYISWEILHNRTAVYCFYLFDMWYSVTAGRKYAYSNKSFTGPSTHPLLYFRSHRLSFEGWQM